MKNVSRYLLMLAAFAWFIGKPSAQTPTYPYDHIHLNVPDPAVASAWYEQHIGGRRHTEAPDRIMYGSTRLMFLRNATAKPSEGSAIDHIGFSFADLDAKMKEWEAAGIKVVTPMRDVPGLFKLAFLEDPWGTRIEVVQDPELLGLHHLHLRNPNPDEGYAWLLDTFGGKRQPLKGRLDAVRYDYEGFAAAELSARENAAYPPFARLVRLWFQHANPRFAREEAMRVQHALEERRTELGSSDEIIGPSPAYVPRVRGRWRWQLLLRGRDPSALVRDFILPPNWSIDVDPVTLV